MNLYGVQMVAMPEQYDKERRGESFPKKENSLQEGQKSLLTWLIEDVSLFQKVNKILKVEDFREEPYHSVAVLIYKQYEETGAVNPAKIINQFESIEEQNLVASMFNRNLNE